MKIRSIELENFRAFRESRVVFADSLNVFIGENGAGKSSILDAAALLLRCWTSRRKSSTQTEGAGLIAESDIRHGANECTLAVSVADGVRTVDWSLSRTRPGFGATRHSDLTALNQWMQELRPPADRVEDAAPTALPVFAFYSVNRAVLDIPARIKKHHGFGLLSIYEDGFRAGADFRRFFEWFRLRQEEENAAFRESPTPSGATDPQLEAVRRALQAFLPEFTDFKVRFHPLRLEVLKGGEPFSIDQLSDGEKGIIALVGDIARRLAIANPYATDPLQGAGVVLIDEVDLHLHPKWQTTILANLIAAFPNIQFAVTTHSPYVLSSLNNLIFRRQLDARDQAAPTVAPSLRDPGISVWSVYAGAVADLIDPETGLIGSNSFDDESDDSDDEFDDLLARRETHG